MFVHHVFFWLKEGVDRAYFVDQLKKLGAISLVQECRVGEKVASHRDVVEDSYDYSLLLIFANKADHDYYQTDDPDHQVFVNNCLDMWTKVQVFDSMDI